MSDYFGSSVARDLGETLRRPARLPRADHSGVIAHVFIKQRKEYIHNPISHIYIYAYAYLGVCV